jgi:hypothetical protein
MNVIKYVLISFFVNMYFPFLLFIEYDKNSINHGPYIEGIINLLIIFVHFLLLLFNLFRNYSRGLGYKNSQLYQINITSNSVCNLLWLFYYNIFEYLMYNQEQPLSIFNKYSFGSLVLITLYFALDIYISIKAFKPTGTQN